MTRKLLLGPEEQATIAALITKAAANVMPLADVRRLAGERARTGVTINPANDGYTIALPVGFCVTYTHEEQAQCVCRHMSISVDDAPADQGPPLAAVQILLAAFGFENRIPDLPMWLDEGPRTVVNLLEPLDGNIDQLRRKPS